MTGPNSSGPGYDVLEIGAVGSACTRMHGVVRGKSALQESVWRGSAEVLGENTSPCLVWNAEASRDEGEEGEVGEEWRCSWHVLACFPFSDQACFACLRLAAAARAMSAKRLDGITPECTDRNENASEHT